MACPGSIDGKGGNRSAPDIGNGLRSGAGEFPVASGRGGVSSDFASIVPPVDCSDRKGDVGNSLIQSVEPGADPIK
jgi:hypothetical protein